MTNDEKAKAYDEALELARKIHSGEGVDAAAGWSALETIFPELRESEDERIRKALVWHLKADVDFVSNGVTKAECIAYLEKQKERKHPNGCFTCDEYKKGYEEGRRNGFTAGYNKAMKEVEQKEQKPAGDKAFEEWVDGWFKEHKEKAYPQITMDEKEFKNFCRGIRNMYQQKPAERNKATINGEPISTENQSVDIPLAEWSEEDEKRVKEAIKRIDELEFLGIHCNNVRKVLESLRPSWKPSEEQMEVLNKMTLGNFLGSGQYDILRTLYEQLQEFVKS